MNQKVSSALPITRQSFLKATALLPLAALRSGEATVAPREGPARACALRPDCSRRGTRSSL